jgi:hypothetical protein
VCSKGIAGEEDRRALLDLQCEDESWEAGWMYQYGSLGVEIGNRAVTTAMAVAALSSQPTPAKASDASKLGGMREVVSEVVNVNDGK